MDVRNVGKTVRKVSRTAFGQGGRAKSVRFSRVKGARVDDKPTHASQPFHPDEVRAKIK